jgi:hypothetical protein
MAKITGIESAEKTMSELSIAIRGDEERRRSERAVFAAEKLISLVAIDHREGSAWNEESPNFFGLELLLFLAHHPEALKSRKAPKERDCPIKALHQGETADDEHHT